MQVTNNLPQNGDSSNMQPENEPAKSVTDDTAQNPDDQHSSSSESTTDNENSGVEESSEVSDSNGAYSSSS